MELRRRELSSSLSTIPRKRKPITTIQKRRLRCALKERSRAHSLLRYACCEGNCCQVADSGLFRRFAISALTTFGPTRRAMIKLFSGLDHPMEVDAYSRAAT